MFAIIEQTPHTINNQVDLPSILRQCEIWETIRYVGQNVISLN